MTSSEIKLNFADSTSVEKLQSEIKCAKSEIKHQTWLLNALTEDLQAICPHANVVELPGITYDGIAKTYARRFCKICKLEESARDLSGQFSKIKKAHKVITDCNSAVVMAEYMREKDES